MRDESSIDIAMALAAWLDTAPGRYLLGWEQARFDQEVADAFGFHALQLGLPELVGLRANRMPHRWVATDSLRQPRALALPPPADDSMETQPLPCAVALHCEFEALPFPDASIDLVLLPHTLELARDAHQTLREVERVLVPEGRVVIVGFNPTSLWGLRQRLGHLRRAAGFGRERGFFLPRAGEFIGYWRARDWLRLLGFEVEAGRFGCWRPPFSGQRWLQRFAWMDPVGDRWWPVLGAVYEIRAVKRVRGIRLVGLAREERRVGAKAAAAVVTRREGAARRGAAAHRAPHAARDDA